MRINEWHHHCHQEPKIVIYSSINIFKTLKKISNASLPSVGGKWKKSWQAEQYI
jgi:hypothetical protein